ncbi:MAG: nucleotide sugar dehydrogenase [Phenylobacterium sp.]|uniref:nucleotide sugar dehydrogenase n=1 Tax=Phenylobacterium sp. TaxID=1871053 RepID=UPI0027358993|nr:nucleotide sugar dehydrogenase [Phenylobacterium sp.]MDP3175777.1 nucleotide sugar dehydrogenase [Phenylobacterium sp.]
MSDTGGFTQLRDAIEQRTAVIGVIGLGYVGLPLAAAAARAGFPVVGFDTDPAKPALINAGRSYIDAVDGRVLADLVARGRISATDDLSGLAGCDVVVICVPTPLTRHRDPDLSYVEATTRTIAQYLRAPQLVVLESTTYPGTTREVLKPILEAAGHVSGRDAFLAFSPEREDPGNAAFSTVTIPKVVAGDGAEAQALVVALYGAIVDKVVPVSSLDVAEAVKITENIFRAVNIALVNELKVIFSAMDIDVWEVIEAAKTKPFGYMPFYPGPGLGGHCIPIDPFYLTWKSREFELPTRFIELAGEVNLSMPRYVVDKLAEALDRRLRLALSASRVLVLGLAYKKNVSDLRESPSLKLIELLEARGAEVSFHDPHIAEIPPTREWSHLAGRKSVALDAGALAGFDAVLIATDHDMVDYALVVRHAKLVVDTRNVVARLGLDPERVVKA